MLKKTLVTLVAVILCVAMLVGCSAPATEPSTEASAGASTEASGEASTEASSAAEPAGDFTPAADLAIPPPNTPLSLPVDQAAEEPIKIATIMVQNNPFGAAVLVGQNWAKEALADRNWTVDCQSVQDFDPQKWASIIENDIAAGYDAICFFGFS